MRKGLRAELPPPAAAETAAERDGVGRYEEEISPPEMLFEALLKSVLVGFWWFVK